MPWPAPPFGLRLAFRLYYIAGRVTMTKPIRAAWLVLPLALSAGTTCAQAAAPPSPAVAVTQTTTGDHNTTIGIVNGQVTISAVDPAMVALMVRTFTDQISATAEAR